jgi:coenzyme F420-reducing hydrogenase delta subunit
MYWLSSAESEKLVKSVEDAFEKVKRVGPNPINTMNIKSSKKKVVTTP